MSTGMRSKIGVSAFTSPSAAPAKCLSQFGKTAHLSRQTSGNDVFRFALKPVRHVTIHMGIAEDVSKRLTTAMKAKDTDATRALRLIRAGFLTKMKEDGSSSLDDTSAIAVLRKLAKMRKESIDMFRQGGREDLAKSEEHDLAIIDNYLPQLADEETTIKWAQEAIDESGASGPAQAGKAIGVLMKKHRGEIDGALAKSIVTKLLAK